MSLLEVHKITQCQKNGLPWISPGKYKADPPCSTDLRHSGTSAPRLFSWPASRAARWKVFRILFPLDTLGTTFSRMQASRWKMSPSEWLNYQMAFGLYICEIWLLTNAKIFLGTWNLSELPFVLLFIFQLMNYRCLIVFLLFYFIIENNDTGIKRSFFFFFR